MERVVKVLMGTRHREGTLHEPTHLWKVMIWVKSRLRRSTSCTGGRRRSVQHLSKRGRLPLVAEHDVQQAPAQQAEQGIRAAAHHLEARQVQRHLPVM